MASTASHSNPADPSEAWLLAGLPYHSLNFYYRRRFGAKVWKLSLDAGFDCPNRDGTLGAKGCIFCNPAGFSPSRRLGLTSIADQAKEGIQRLKQRYGVQRFVAYFQPATNTYAPIDRLRAVYEEALAIPEIVGLAIGTRPDCVGEDVLDLLADLAGRTWVVVEYGMQTIHDRTLDLIHRGHHYDAFLDAYQRTRRRKIDVGVHVILGLPGESREDQLATALQLAQLEIHSVKLHNLYAMRGTPLAEEVMAGRIRLPEFQEYVTWAVDLIERLPPQVVIERLSGDAPAEYLLGPQWCLDKPAIHAAIHAEFTRRNTHQRARWGLLTNNNQQLPEFIR